MRSLKRLSKLGAIIIPIAILFFITYYTGQVSSTFNNVIGRRNWIVGNDPSSGVDPNQLSNITRREDYTCSPDRPCSNGACCGASGNCGYGKDYCGDGCVSNCDAAAECGKHARPSGKRCPLNTCCSEYGFCGTTEVRKMGEWVYICHA